MFKNLINIITSPTEAFASIKEKPSIAFPYFFIFIISASVLVLFFSRIDPAYLIDQLVEQAIQADPTTQEGEMRAVMESIPSTLILIPLVLAAALGLPFILAIYAGFLSFISKLSDNGITFKQWFSLLFWCAIPTVFSSLAALITILMSSNGILELQQLQPFSLNNLIFQTSGEFKSLLDSLDLSQLWSLGLVVLGFQHWTKKSLTSSILTAGAPYLLIYGIWALITLI